MSTTIAIKCIGETAQQIISQDQTGQVLGVTSRGVFLHFSANKVIFLSYEPYKGPLTLNLAAGSTQLSSLSLGSAVQICSKDLNFDSVQIRILTGESATWQTHPPVGTIQPVHDIHQQLVYITNQLLTQNRTSDISSLLPHILGFSNASIGISIEKNLLLKMNQLQQALKNLQTVRIAAILGSLLGFGSGLTPSGDDLAIGLLLTLNRWGETLIPRIQLQELNQQIVQTAKQKTTSLSANLIECAANGEADERLINTLDGIFSGHPEAEECAKLLLSWGNSSGGDSLVGMALGLSLLNHSGESSLPIST